MINNVKFTDVTMKSILSICKKCYHGTHSWNSLPWQHSWNGKLFSGIYYIDFKFREVLNFHYLPEFVDFKIILNSKREVSCQESHQTNIYNSLVPVCTLVHAVYVFWSRKLRTNQRWQAKKSHESKRKKSLLKSSKWF